MEKTDLLVFKTRIESRLKSCKDIVEFRHITRQFVQEMGFSDFDYQLILGEGHIDVAEDLSTVSKDLLSYYTEWGLGNYDMLIEYCVYNRAPIFIKTIYDHLSSLPFETDRIHHNLRVRDLLQNYRYDDSFSIPIHHHDKSIDAKEICLFSVFCERKSSEHLKTLVNRKHAELMCLSNIFYSCWYKKYFKPEGSQPKRKTRLLSERQTEILQQFAILGPSSKRVGERLCRSSRTIEKHAENIRKILNVRSTTEAVVIGIQKGLIKPFV